MNDHNDQDDGRGSRTLLFLTITYGAASLVHFAHNAIFLRQYPNLPAWLTAGGVWAVSAHSIAMSMTIIVEVATASALLICIGYSCRNATIGSTRLARRAGM